MDYQISNAGGDIAFGRDAGETILDAAGRSGYVAPYSCRKGVCSTCEGGFVSGDGRSPVELGQGDSYCAACVRQGDVTIAPRKIEKRERILHKTLDVSAHRVGQPASDVSIVLVRLPIGVHVKSSFHGDTNYL